MPTHPDDPISFSDAQAIFDCNRHGVVARIDAKKLHTWRNRSGPVVSRAACLALAEEEKRIAAEPPPVVAPAPVVNATAASSDVPTDLITMKAAAELVKCSVPTLRRYVRIGDLPAWRRGAKNLYVSRADCLALFAPVEPNAPAPQPQPRMSMGHQQAVEYLKSINCW